MSSIEPKPAGGARAAAGGGRPPAEAEGVAGTEERLKDVVDRAEAGRARRPAPGAKAVVPEGVVRAPPLRIGEHLVGLGGSLELLLGLGVVVVDVGMQLAGEAAERLLYLRVRGAAVDTEHLVVVARHCLVLVDAFEVTGKLAGGLAHRGDRGGVVHAERAEDADRAEVAMAEAVVGTDH